MRETDRFTGSTRLARVAAVLALGAAAVLSTGPVPASGSTRAPDIPDYQSALDAVRSPAVLDAVCRFLGVPVPKGGAQEPQAIPDTTDPCDGLPAFTVNDPLAFNEIAPGFVAGTSRPIATEAIALSQLVSSLSVEVDGRQATVILAPTPGGGWHLAAVRDGDAEVGYAGKAAPGALVFTEPQIRAWYVLKLVTVEPLNDQARQSLGGRASMSLSEYQTVVKARYADKQPGSEYDTKGMSSGYGAAPDDGPAPLLVGGSSAALVLGGIAFLLHRRRRHPDD
ncbi:hypothetical protein ACIGNX_02535 [Actinosynnema sp. NPDC053489]|uniref:hypothetical protein n=1 Tax=Actinosynnema sp. NPDC053489 TaxID=3363916 RepID=UPI0037C5B121